MGDGNDIGTLEGCIVVELHHIYGYVEALQIPCTVTVEKRYWDEEGKRFDCESYVIKDIEKWQLKKHIELMCFSGK